MPELDAEHRDQLAEALRARVIDWNTLAGPGSNRGVSEYLTDALAPLVAGWIADARVSALTETADKWQTGEWTVLTPEVKRGGAAAVVGGTQAVTDWLRARADQIGGT